MIVFPKGVRTVTGEINVTNRSPLKVLVTAGTEREGSAAVCETFGIALVGVATGTKPATSFVARRLWLGIALEFGDCERWVALDSRSSYSTNITAAIALRKITDAITTARTLDTDTSPELKAGGTGGGV
ncbi:MAG TPA: hypothetical protein VN825_06985 [Candidatus Acidoferrum sp.]|nr:hypothetical protein [Candidatus Acidoferrum sp.]